MSTASRYSHASPDIIGLLGLRRPWGDYELPQNVARMGFGAKIVAQNMSFFYDLTLRGCARGQSALPTEYWGS